MQKEEMIKLATELLYQKGFRAFSLNAILSELKISKGSFYHHFKNRDEFMFAILSKESQNYRYAVEKEIYKPQSLKERLYKIYEFYCVDTKQHREVCAFYEDLFSYALQSENSSLFRSYFQSFREDTNYLLMQSIEVSNLSAQKKTIAFSLCEFLSSAIDGFFLCYPYTVSSHENIDLWALRQRQIVNLIEQFCILLEKKSKEIK